MFWRKIIIVDHTCLEMLCFECHNSKKCFFFLFVMGGNDAVTGLHIECETSKYYVFDH